VTARRIGTALAIVIMATSALYLLVYLYRWEWNRALIAGLFFVAAEVAVMGTSMLRRLRRIEQKLDDAAAQRTLEHLRETAPEPENRFRWLDDSATKLNVFVPVLLGAGVVLTVIAQGVERLAAATARPTLERRLATRMTALALPQGGLLATGPVSLTPPSGATGNRALNRLFVSAVAVLAVLAALQGIDLIADATQTRADAIDHSSTLELTISVDTKGRVPGETDTAEALWVACRGVLNRHVTTMHDEPERLAPGIYRLDIQPAVGHHARRRLRGCLEDSTLDRISGRVISMVELKGSS
jgi:hypothetical protein